MSDDEKTFNFEAIRTLNEMATERGSVLSEVHRNLIAEEDTSTTVERSVTLRDFQRVTGVGVLERVETEEDDSDNTFYYVDPSMVGAVELDPNLVNAIDWSNLITNQQEGTQEFNLGTNSRPWGSIYTQNGVIQTSDMNAKRFIRDCDLGLSFVLGLRPVSFTWRNQRSMVPTFGFLGQEVETALKGRGFAGLHQDNGGYSLRYVDFIAPMVKSIQQQQEQIKALKKEISELRGLIASRG